LLLFTWKTPFFDPAHESLDLEKDLCLNEAVPPSLRVFGNSGGTVDMFFPSPPQKLSRKGEDPSFLKIWESEEYLFSLGDES